MTRSNPSKLHAYNLEIDKTFHRLIKSSKSSEVANNSHNGSAFAFDSVVLKSDNIDFDSDPSNSDSSFGVDTSKFSLDNMVNNNQTLKELATPNIIEDTHNHFKEFHVVCSTILSHGILEDYIKMNEFPFSLDGVAMD
ncbi:hypothetical protein CR513_02386, partial [Mucuna pruriens]